MTLEEFLKRNINENRGGYTPAEVKRLCSQAWAESSRNHVEHALEAAKRELGFPASELPETG